MFCVTYVILFILDNFCCEISVVTAARMKMIDCWKVAQHRRVELFSDLF
jgi:hypothetical protein